MSVYCMNADAHRCLSTVTASYAHDMHRLLVQVYAALVNDSIWICVGVLA